MVPPNCRISTTWHFMHICCIYTFVPKYNLFSLNNVTCMYVFGAGISLLGKTIIPTPDFLQLPLVLYVGLGSHGFFSSSWVRDPPTPLLGII